MSKKLTTEEFIEKAKLIHNDNYNYDLVDYKDACKKVKIKCNTCGNIFEQKPSNHLNGQGCPNLCFKKIDRESLFDSFLEKAKLIHNDNYDYSLVEYVNSKTPIKIICKKCGNIFEQRPNNHLNGHGCLNCSLQSTKTKLSKTTEQFIKEARLIHNDNYDYSLVEYVNSKTPIKIICKKCGNIFEQAPTDHISGHGCPNCSKTKKPTTEEFKEKAKLIHGDKYNYDLVEYVNNRIKVKIKCNICGEIFLQSPNNHLVGYGCSNCSTNKGERFANSFFKENNIIFETQKIYDDLKDVNYLKFDFYFPNKNILLEIDGEGHRIPTFGRTKEERENNLLLQKKHDDMKNEYCKLNNINLVRIEYNKANTKKLKKDLETFLEHHIKE